MNPLTPAAFVLFVVTLGAAAPAAADSAADVAFHIRTTDRRLAGFVRQGMQESPAFRTLVARLVRSDVVVYLQCEGYVRTGGQLTFVSAGGGYRYVRVRLARLTNQFQQIALIGHELQHAVEIADEPDIVDTDSLARQYRRFGRVSQISARGIEFDSIGAVETGYQVLREMHQGAAGD